MEDLVNLGKYQIYLKLMIDGCVATIFLQLPPAPLPEVSFRDQTVAMSRKNYTRSKAEVEKAIVDWHESEKKLGANKETMPTKEEDANRANKKRKQNKIIPAVPITPAIPDEKLKINPLAKALEEAIKAKNNTKTKKKQSL